MSDTKSENGLDVAARRIPVPKHLSPAAQAWLSMPRSVSPPSYPALNDAAGWRRHIAATDAMIKQMFLNRQHDRPCRISDLREGSALGYEVIPEGTLTGDRRVYLDIHGGALIMGAGEVCKEMAAST